MDFWDMHYGDALRYEIERIGKPRQRALFLRAYKEMGVHILEYPCDEFLTFGEYYGMFGNG